MNGSFANMRWVRTDSVEMRVVGAWRRRPAVYLTYREYSSVALSREQQQIIRYRPCDDLEWPIPEWPGKTSFGAPRHVPQSLHTFAFTGDVEVNIEHCSYYILIHGYLTNSWCHNTLGLAPKLIYSEKGDTEPNQTSFLIGKAGLNPVKGTPKMKRDQILPGSPHLCMHCVLKASGRGGSQITPGIILEPGANNWTKVPS